MQFIVIGFCARTTPVALLEQLAFLPGETGAASARLIQHPALLEATIVATCNRVEVYAVAPDTAAAEAEILRFLSVERELPLELLERHCYRHSCGGAVEHLFRVAAGLDSLVLGETEILAQVKRCANQAQAAGAAGALLNKVFMQAAEAGKRVRAETGITRGHTSLASVAVEAVRDVYPDLSAAAVLVLGAGQISERVVRLLACRQVKQVYVANRTHARAEELAMRYGGTAVSLADLPEVLPRVDAVIVGTAAPYHLLTAATVQAALRDRHQPLVCVDISVPRNVDSAVGSLSGVVCHDMNTLAEVVHRSMDDRGQAVAQAESLIGLQMNEFLNWFNGLDATPTIAALQDVLEALRVAEIDRLGGRWSTPLGERDRETLHSITRGIVQKVLHGPVMRLRSVADADERKRYLQAIAALFGLEPPTYSDQYMRQRQAAREQLGRCPVRGATTRPEAASTPRGSGSA